MALLPGVFKPGDVKEDELLDDGFYMLEVVKSSMKDTKSGTGKYLSLSMKVTQAEDENSKGYFIFVNMNLVNDNPQAVHIAEKEFKSLCEALELEEVEDSAELHGIPFCAKVATCPGSGDFPDSNCIKKYLPESDYDDVIDDDDA